MEINHLRYFIALVEESTYTRAAQRLHISQPSLSATIKRLEKELGLTLMDRSGKKSKLTKEGGILYQEAKNLIHHFDYLTDEMARLKVDGPLELSIGLIESSLSWMPKIIKHFKQSHQNVHIKLVETLSLQDVIEALSNFNIQIAVTNQYINNQSIETIPIYEEKLVVLLPPFHPLKNKSEITFNHLEKEELIICKEGYQTREDVLNAFCKTGTAINIQFEVERFETASSMVEEGLGITIVPENYVNTTPYPNYNTRHLDDKGLSRMVYLAYMKNRHLPPLVYQFIEMIKKEFVESNRS